MNGVGLYERDEVCRTVNDAALSEDELTWLLIGLHGTLQRFVLLSSLTFLSTRLSNVLRENRIERIYDIQEVEPYRWRQMKNLGPTT
jgi:hypothetical protein